VSKPTGSYPSLTLDTAGAGVVSHAGAVLLSTTVTTTGPGLSTALARWRHPNAIHDPGKIVCDLAIALAPGGDCLADIAALRACLTTRSNACSRHRRRTRGRAAPGRA
jgi:hypothetical protein